MVLCGPIALLPRYFLGIDPRIVEHGNYAHEGVWVESPRVMVLSFPKIL